MAAERNRSSQIVGFLQEVYCTHSFVWMYLFTDTLNIVLV